jgi:hypothetical protein
MIREDFERTGAVLKPEERQLVDLEIWIRNFLAAGILAKRAASSVLVKTAENRLEHEREIKAKATGIREGLTPEGKQRVADAIEAWEAFDKFMPDRAYPSDALSGAILYPCDGNADDDGGHRVDALSLIANRIDGELPARGKCMPDADAADEEGDPADLPTTGSRKVFRGYTKNRAQKRKDSQREVVTELMLSPYRAELSALEQSAVLAWLDGAGQAEIAQLSDVHQATISRLLKKVLKRARALAAGGRLLVRESQATI